jgi:thiol-disulfide isomerase/thioredoxin
MMGRGTHIPKDNMPVPVETAEELEAVKAESTIIMYTSETCSPCIHFKSKYQELEEAYPEITFCTVALNTKAFKSSGRIGALPTFRRYHKGILVGEVAGLREEEVISLITTEEIERGHDAFQNLVQ